MITEEDFKPINFGIFIAEKGANEFVLQFPVPFDKIRAAQKCCILFINRQKHEVEGWKDALELCNKHMGGGMMTEQVTLLGENLDGCRVVLRTVPMQPGMKREDIARNYFSTTREDTEGELCLMALNDYHEWLLSQGWIAPKIEMTPITQGDGQ